MDSFNEVWHMHFIPECYFDTILIKKLLQTNRRLVHRKGCNNVVNDLESRRLNGEFAVGIIDKEKRELAYLKRCNVLYNADKIVVLKHRERSQYILQLNPPIEQWLLLILEENGLKIENYGYSNNVKKLKQQIKDDIDDEKDDKLNKLVSAIINTDCTTIRKIKSLLLYLKEKNYQTDINELING